MNLVGAFAIGVGVGAAAVGIANTVLLGRLVSIWRSAESALAQLPDPFEGVAYRLPKSQDLDVDAVDRRPDPTVDPDAYDDYSRTLR